MHGKTPRASPPSGGRGFNPVDLWRRNRGGNEEMHRQINDEQAGTDSRPCFIVIPIGFHRAWRTCVRNGPIWRGVVSPHANVRQSFARSAPHNSLWSQRVSVMPIRPFLADQSFDPEVITAMSLALERVCDALRLKAIDDIATRLVAEKIIKQAQRGIR